MAAKGSDHFFVYKEESAAGTATRIRKLAPSERVEQIARMLSGTDVTEAGARAGPPAARRPGLLTEVRTFRYFVPASETGFPRIA